MAKPTDKMSIEIYQKKDYADEYAKEISAPECILNEVKEQIEICEEMLRYVSRTMIQDWLKSKSLNQLAVKVKTHKFFA